MIVHELKTWQKYFEAVADGSKRFEVRSVADRTFAVGDLLILREWDPSLEVYSGRSVRVEVTYVLGTPFAHEGYVILSIDPAHRWVPSAARSIDVCERCGVDEGTVNYLGASGVDRVGPCLTTTQEGGP